MKILIIGAGTMGSGIAQVAIQAGHSTTLMDVSTKVISAAKLKIENGLNKLVQKGIITDDKKSDALSNIAYTNSYDEMKQVDLAIEAATELIDIKEMIIRQASELVKDGGIFATNTSSIPISLLANSFKDPSRFIGIHFMNPVPLMKGVEIIPGIETTKKTVEEAVKFVKDMGKIPSKASDTAGFITNRLIGIYLNEAAETVLEGNDPVEVDRMMKVCFNMPMGPCELIDLIGVDVTVDMLNVMSKAFGDRYIPNSLLMQLYNSGNMGKKSGSGFYRYEKGKRQESMIRSGR